jgi:hypothetical protein
MPSSREVIEACGGARKRSMAEEEQSAGATRRDVGIWRSIQGSTE